MSIRNLDYLFKPKSVAVIGASNRPRSVGATVMRNLLEGGFSGPIMPVNPKYEAVAGVLAYPDVASLPKAPELAVICTPAKIVPGLISELGQRGTKAAVVLTAGLTHIKDEWGRTLQEAMLEAAKPHLMRILGPNCVGLIVPGLGLNASFAHTSAAPGKIAFVSQSGGLTTGVLDWAKSKGIGFSYFISLGDGADVDFGDVLDFLASEANTSAILLYIESIKASRKFMSAARAAARNKPVLAVKAGRAPEGAKAAASHTGALAGSDDVYDAAIRRAGMLRVFSIEDLFDAVETLARSRAVKGDRLTIITNGGGPGVMATDTLVLNRGRLASLSEQTISKLDEVLPPTWSRGNPVDIIGDAPVERYVETLKIVLQDPQSDAILFIHVPTAVVSSTDIATAVAPIVKQATRSVMGCWLGSDAVARARQLFSEAGIPTYQTPGEAVRGFLQVVEYRRNQELLMETPPSVPIEFTPDVEEARSIVQEVLESERELMTEPEAKAILANYGIPVVETRVATEPEEAKRVAEQLGLPVAIKILSPDISHKSDVGGVVLDLETGTEVREAASAMLKRLKKQQPKAKLTGFSVQKMARRPKAFELIIGATTDPIFGPIILFGQGGTAVEVIRDQAIGLPPLNMILARELISRTRISRLLAGYRDRPPVDQDAICLALIQISQIMADIPEIVELDINPLFADEQGVLALDARIRVKSTTVSGPERFAIRPYPQKLEEWVNLDGQRVLLRPIRPEDEPQHAEFFRSLKPEDVRFRFFGQVRQFPHSQLARYTQIDYDREMSFVAVAEDEQGNKDTLGEVRAVADPDNIRAEFAIVVRSDIKGHGLGSVLLEKMIRYCRERDTTELHGETVPQNERMLNLAKDLGFELKRSTDGQTVQLNLKLQLG